MYYMRKNMHKCNNAEYEHDCKNYAEYLSRFILQSLNFYNPIPFPEM